MYRHLGLHWFPGPTSLTGRRARPTPHRTLAGTQAISSGTAIGLATSTLFVGAAVLSAVPLTVTVPLATVLGLGMIVGAVVAGGTRRRAIRRADTGRST